MPTSGTRHAPAGAARVAAPAPALERRRRRRASSRAAVHTHILPCLTLAHHERASQGGEGQGAPCRLMYSTAATDTALLTMAPAPSSAAHPQRLPHSACITVRQFISGEEMKGVAKSGCSGARQGMTGWRALVAPQQQHTTASHELRILFQELHNGAVDGVGVVLLQ